MYKPAHYDLFISYAANDADWVEGFFIPTLGLPAERIITRESFRPGADTVAEFERAIVNSRYTVLVLSPAFLADMWASYSESIASYLRVNHERDTLVPLLLKSCELSPRITSLKLSFDCTDKTQQNAELARLRDFLKQPEPPLQSLPCPYPGMRPFTERESHYFFGRDREVQELIERLASHPLVTIIGPSGSGKSSLVFAGLVPALEQGKFGHRPQEWSVYTMRPGENPLSELHRIFGHDGTHPENALKTIISEQAGTRHVLLVVDQFEELFTLAQAEALPFQKTLQELITTSACRIVITVRADFYQDVMTSLLWNHIQQCRQEIIPLKTEGLRDAILKPAEHVGVFVETALVERLVADAANEPGVLPFVQETLALLWDGLERRFLPLYAYEALSSSGGPQLTGLQVAIARHADTVLAQVHEHQQYIARRIFLRLVQFGEGRPDTRRQQSISTLRSANENRDVFDQTLEHFTHHRLLTQTGREHEEGSRVDIAHDALIDGWPTLQQWIKERRKAEQLRRHLETKAAEWERLQRKGGLLDEIEVREAEEWLNSPEAKILGYSHALPELVKFSQQAITNELEKARKTAQQLRKRFILATTFAIGAILAAIVAFYGFRQATRNEELANQQKEVAQQERDRANQERDNARIQTIEALNQNSKTLFLEHDELKALLSSVKAGIYAKQSNISQTLKEQTTFNLQEILYNIYETNRIEGHGDVVTSLDFSPDGTLLASSSRNNLVKLWRVADGKEMNSLSLEHSDWISSDWIDDVKFSPTGSILAAMGRDGNVKLWDVITGRAIKTLTGRYGIGYSIEFNSTGTMLAIAHSHGGFYLWDVQSGRKIIEHHDSERSGDVYSVAFSPVSPILAFGTDRRRYGSAIILWDIIDNKEIGRLHGHSWDVRMVIFSPDGNTLASAGGQDCTAKLWNIKERTEITTLSLFNGAVRSLAFSPNGNILAIGSSDGLIKLWSISDNREILSLQGHSDIVNRIAFSPDGNMLVSGSGDKTIKIWKIQKDDESTILKEMPDTVKSIAFNPSGTILASFP